ncbi:MAG: cytidylate kinase family protein, partial [Methanobrevibacter sp.]|nr:cytidylate kinase family protein [Methanobrevibacter sp.]
MIITIGGLAGSGTTTAAEVLSKKLDIPFVSAGSTFREMASERGMTIFELSKFAENNTDIDIEVDKRQADLAKGSENLIVEGRLSAYFVEADLKIWMIAPLEVRAKRICYRESKSIELAIRETKLR